MRRAPFRPVTLGLLLLTAAWTPARADLPAVDADGAKSLAAAIKDGLARWFPPPADEDEDEDAEGSQVVVDWQGEPVVTPAGDHYAVALPRLTVENAEGTRLDVGTVLLTVTPRDGGTYTVTATLPDRIPVREVDEDGAVTRESAAFTIGRQEFSGLWSPSLQTMTTVDASYGDLALTAAKGKGVITIGSATMMQELKPDGDAAGNGTAGNGTDGSESARQPPRWSGPGAFTLSKLSARDETGRELAAIDGLSVDTQTDHIDLSRLAALNALTAAARAKGETPSLTDMLGMLRGLTAGGSGRLRLSGLSFHDPKPGGYDVTLGQISMRFGVEGLDRDLATLTMAYDTRAIVIKPSPEPQAFIPRDASLQFTFDKLPTDALWQALSRMAKASDARDAGGDGLPAKPDDAVMAQVGQTVLAALAQSGTELRIDTLTLDTPSVAGKATGSAHYAPTSPFGAAGGALIHLRGLDAAAKALKPEPGQKPDKDTQQALGVVAMLQAMGQAGKDDAGNEERTYKIDVTADGQLLLNGADMSALLGAAAGPEPEPHPKPKKGAVKP